MELALRVGAGARGPGLVAFSPALGHTPVSDVSPAGGDFLSRTARAARQYQTWLWNDFVLDGVAFFDRPFFLNPECHVWDVVGVADLAPYDEHQVVLRTERFRVPATSQDPLLAASWSDILPETRRRGLTGGGLLHYQPEQ